MFKVNGLMGHVERNNTRSLVMLGGFFLAAQIIMAAIAALPLMIFDRGSNPLTNLWSYLATYGPFAFFATALLFAWHLRSHVSRMRRTIGFRDLCGAEERRLVSIVDRMAVTAGIPAPAVSIIETGAMNAFACGLTRAHARIVVTRGLVNGLDDEELEAVVAHEIAHIVHNDIRLLACVNAMSTMVTAMREFMLTRKGGKETSPWQIALVGFLMPPVLLLFGAIHGADRLAAFLVTRSRFAINTSREFIADAEAARLTQNPAALVSALRRIEGRSRLEGVDLVTGSMMIDGAALGPDATHPSIEERVGALLRIVGSVTDRRFLARDTRPGAMSARAADDLASQRGGFGRRRGDAARALARAPAPSALAPSALAPSAPAPSASSRAAPSIRPQAWNGTSPSVRHTPVRRAADGKSAKEGQGSDDEKSVLIVALCIAPFLLVPFLVKGPLGFMLPGGGIERDFRQVVTVDGPLRAHVKRSARRTAPARTVAGRTVAGRTAPAVAVPEPAEGRCFSSRSYGPGRRSFGRIDPVEVRAWARGARYGDPISMERFMGLHLRAARAVPREAGHAQDAALLVYLATRKNMLVQAHRRFGDKGLARMRRAQRSASDIRVLELLRLRLAGRGALSNDAQTRHELALLLSDPKAFLPCQAKALGIE